MRKLEIRKGSLLLLLVVGIFIGSSCEKEEEEQFLESDFYGEWAFKSDIYLNVRTMSISSSKNRTKHSIKLKLDAIVYEEDY